MMKLILIPLLFLLACSSPPEAPPSLLAPIFNQSGTPIQIEPGETLTIDGSTAILGQIDIRGTLILQSGTLNTSGNIFVHDGGSLLVQPKEKVEVVWHLTQAQANAFKGGDGVESSDIGLWVFSGGTWISQGKEIRHPWTKLASTALQGASNIEVQHDVSDWSGEIVLAGTSNPRTFTTRADGRTVSSVEHEDETTTILDLGSATTLAVSTVRNTHLGGDRAGHVGLLSRNVVYRTVLEGYSPGDVRDRKFAHTMCMRGSTCNISYSEFSQMGNYGTLGRYPIHTHRMGETSKGMTFKGNSIHHTGFRCINLHVSHGVTVEDNVCYDISSSAFFEERDDLNGFNEDNAFIHNLGILVHPKHFNDRSNRDVDGEYHRTAMFWPAHNAFNTLWYGNVAANGGIEQTKEVSGFHFPEIDNQAGNQAPDPETLIIFAKNEAYGFADFGLFTWQNGVPNFIILDNKLWNNGRTGLSHGAYGAKYEFHHLDISGSPKGTSSTSVNFFLQDSQISNTEQGVFLGGYIAAQTPGDPIWIARNTFKDQSLGITQDHNNTCDQDTTNRPVLTGRIGKTCVGVYTEIVDNSFTNVDTPYDFGFTSNVNSFWKVFDEEEAVVLFGSPDGVISNRLHQPTSVFSDSTASWSTDLGDLEDIEFTGLLNERPLNEQNKSPNVDFLFTTNPPVLPQISLTLDISEGSVRGDIQTDGNASLYLNGEVQEGPISLLGYPHDYAYIFAGAEKDGFTAYSQVYEVDVRDLRAPEPTPTPVPPTPTSTAVQATPSPSPTSTVSPTETPTPSPTETPIPPSPTPVTGCESLPSADELVDAGAEERMILLAILCELKEQK